MVARCLLHGAQPSSWTPECHRTGADGCASTPASEGGSGTARRREGTTVSAPWHGHTTRCGIRAPSAAWSYWVTSSRDTIMVRSGNSTRLAETYDNSLETLGDSRKLLRNCPIRRPVSAVPRTQGSRDRSHRLARNSLAAYTSARERTRTVNLPDVCAAGLYEASETGVRRETSSLFRSVENAHLPSK